MTDDPLPTAEKDAGRYEPCVIDQDGMCTRWSHEHSRAIECCASGRCEVCSPGFVWGRDG